MKTFAKKTVKHEQCQSRICKISDPTPNFETRLKKNTTSQLWDYKTAYLPQGWQQQGKPPQGTKWMETLEFFPRMQVW